MRPARPANLSAHAEKILAALGESGLGHKLSLGGALGLQHYLDFRTTHDDRARLAVETHLARIAQHRPVAEIGDPEERAHAERLRAWFTTEFLDALLD
jgi:hypothetical protein